MNNGKYIDQFLDQMVRITREISTDIDRAIDVLFDAWCLGVRCGLDPRAWI